VLIWCVYTTFSTETLGRSNIVLRNSFFDCIQTYTETTEIISVSVDSDSFPGLSFPSGLCQPSQRWTGEGYHDWRGIYGGALEGEVWLQWMCCSFWDKI